MNFDEQVIKNAAHLGKLGLRRLGPGAFEFQAKAPYLKASSESGRPPESVPLLRC